MIADVAGSDSDLAPDEDLVVRLRRHPTALVVPLLVMAGAAIPAGVIASFVPDPVREPLSIVAWLVAAGAIIWWGLLPAVDALTAHHTLTSRRLVLHQGLVSRRRSSAPTLTIPLVRISDVDADDTVFGRLVGAGTLVVHRTQGGPVRLRDVPDVGRLQALVLDLADDARTSDPTGEVGGR